MQSKHMGNVQGGYWILTMGTVQDGYWQREMYKVVIEHMPRHSAQGLHVCKVVHEMMY